MRALLLMSCALIAAPAVAVGQGGLARPAWLPEDQLILQALEASPGLQEANANYRGAEAEARLRRAGDHETLISTAFDDRKVRQEGRYSEWSVQASRGLRLPGKAALDRAAGQAGVSAAHDSVDDARHQLSLVFADLWVGWAEAEARLKLNMEEVVSYQRATVALKRRVELKDASQLDLDIARGAEARALARAARSRGEALTARAAVEARFPTLVTASAPALPEPLGPIRALEAWPQVIIERSHEIRIARALADRERILARRAVQDRVPDPTVGVRTFSERGGDESGVGVFVSIPISGLRRSAEADRQASTAAAAEARFSRTAREVEAIAQADVIAVRAAFAGWSAASDALTAAEDAAQRSARAYELGERDLQDRLIADRAAFEAGQEELTARAEAHRAVLRLALDAHELWLTEEHPGQEP